MSFSTSAALAVLLCVALSVNAQQASKVRAQQTSKVSPQPAAKLDEKLRPFRPLPVRSSSSSNFNFNSNKNNNDNFIFSSLFAQLLSKQGIQTLIPCDEDDEPCFWRMIEAARLAKSPEMAKENQDDVAASDDDAESVNVEERSNDMERSRHRHPASSSNNFNFNSNKNGNSNIDIVSLFASLQQFVRNQRKLTKETTAEQ